MLSFGRQVSGGNFPGAGFRVYVFGDGPAVGNGNHGSVRWTCTNVGPVFGTVFCKQNKLNEKIKLNFCTQYCCCTSVCTALCAVIRVGEIGKKKKYIYNEFNQCGRFPIAFECDASDSDPVDHPRAPALAI